MDKEDNSKRKNLVVLTVIAIVTMVVVLVGATFAYLASSVETSNNSNISARTEAGSDLFLITPGEDLSIVANDDNFKKAAGDLSDTTTSDILFQTSNTTEKTKTYNVSLNIESNDFEYSSGTCYTKIDSSKVDSGITTYASCVSEGGYYAKTSSSTSSDNGYQCYIGLDDEPSVPVPTVISSYNNSVTCLSKNSNMWAKNAVPELVVDLYKEETDASAVDDTSCTALGKCVDNMTRAISDGTAGSCGSGKTWFPDIWEDNICYSIAVSKDVTEKRAGSIVLLEDEEVSAVAGVNNGTATKFYKPVITLINFGHNQLVNGSKSFVSKLEFAINGETE